MLVYHVSVPLEIIIIVIVVVVVVIIINNVTSIFFQV